MKKIIAITAASLAIAGCSNMSNTEQRTLSGASIGAVAGGVGAAIFHGNPIWADGRERPWRSPFGCEEFSRFL